MISLSVLLQVVFLPILGAIADYSHRKKQFMAVFAYIGAFATMGLVITGAFWSKKMAALFRMLSR